MPQVRANGLSFEYDTFGDPGAEPVLLIMGLGSQMIAWPVELCTAIADGGYHVIRFDNRDVGLSTKLEEAKPPGTLSFVASHLGFPMHAPYTLDDMALDAVGVCDALELGPAHVVGASMGGMIAQLIAVGHSGHVKTLTSIMSSSGDPDLPEPRREVTRQLTRRPPIDSREDRIAHLVASFGLLIGTGYPRSDEEIRALVVESLDRSDYPDGVARQAAAIIADGSRVERLREIQVPTLVIHGKDDPLIPPECGFSTALHIRGAKLELIDGMGHELPPPLLPAFAVMLVRHFGGGPT
jgi:pimeloyl-ACP methyl ester carboxylesterase